MKRCLVTVALFFLIVIRCIADEGLWLPMLLGQQVYSEMVKKGLKLTPEQLYNINKPSIKDGIIIFGSGCSGTVVSPDGMIFTNHHCGYDIIAAASTIDNNLLRDGFYAKNKNEELPTNLSVQFLLRIDDVTREVMDSLKGLSGQERIQKQSSVLDAINKRMSDPEQSIETRVSAMFKGNQFLAFVYQRYTDIRIVGAPPERIGKFGGDTDNWEWPRHTGDYSIFRIYTNTEGKPAKYSSENVPMKSKWFFPVSLKGMKEGDFTMVWGYPGSTNRYETSYGVALAAEINNPVLVKLRGVRLKYMSEEMKKDPAVKLQLASSYASIANYWKFFDGETKQLVKYNIQAQKKKAEDIFIKWAADKQEYKNIFTEWKKAYDTWRKYAIHRMYINEGIYESELMSLAANLIMLNNALVKSGSTAADIKREAMAADKARSRFLKYENKTSDQNSLAVILKMYYEDVPKDQHPVGLFGSVKNQYGPLDNESTYKKLTAAIFNNTIIFDDTKWNAFINKPDANELQEDPAFYYANAFYTNYVSKYVPYYQQFVAANNELGRLYLKGIMEMNPAKAKLMYPDGTFTMRVSYGSVKSYRPRDAVLYDYVTTSKGILEKYVAGDDEFDLPAKEIELLKKKDFGQYADPVRKDLVVNFITNNDISGGSSGSPVLNGKGELLGLAFDGNYEALGSRMHFDKDLNRTICVDIRYILWCIDKLAGAGNIIKELKLVK